MGNTLGIGIHKGPIHREIGRLMDDSGGLMLDYNANLSDKGQKFRVDDIELEVRDGADLIIDYGFRRYWMHVGAGTNIDLDIMKVLRIDAGYEVFMERLKKWYDIDPKDPEFDPEKESAKRVGVSIKLQD